MLLRRIVRGCETGCGGGRGFAGQTVLSPNTHRLLVCLFIVVACLASAAGFPNLPADAERVDDAEPRRRQSIGQDEALEGNDLLSRQHKTGTSFTDSEQGPQQKPLRAEEDVRNSDGGGDHAERPTDAVVTDAGADDASSLDEDPSLRVAPKYMLELYRKFSNDKYSHPIANIVRSFLNINTGRCNSCKCWRILGRRLYNVVRYDVRCRPNVGECMMCTRDGSIR